MRAAALAGATTSADRCGGRASLDRRAAGPNAGQHRQEAERVRGRSRAGLPSRVRPSGCRHPAGARFAALILDGGVEPGPTARPWSPEAASAGIRRTSGRPQTRDGRSGGRRKRVERIADEAVLRRRVCSCVRANLFDRLCRGHLGAWSRDAALTHAERHDTGDMRGRGARAPAAHLPAIDAVDRMHTPGAATTWAMSAGRVAKLENVAKPSSDSVRMAPMPARCLRVYRRCRRHAVA